MSWPDNGFGNAFDEMSPDAMKRGKNQTGENCRNHHDANIVATMQAHGIPKLLTHNIADFARFSSMTTLLPLIP
jgi:predicted nucleic acid-binding protein